MLMMNGKTKDNWFTTTMNNGIYRLKDSGSWFLASPSNNYNDNSALSLVYDYWGSFEARSCTRHRLRSTGSLYPKV